MEILVTRNTSYGQGIPLQDDHKDAIELSDLKNETSNAHVGKLVKKVGSEKESSDSESEEINCNESDHIESDNIFFVEEVETSSGQQNTV